MKKIITKQAFFEQIAQDEITVGIFSTTWCPDCKRLELFINEITEEHQDKQWFQIDLDELPKVSKEQNIMGIPSLLVFENGEKLAHLHSVNAKVPVREFLSSLVCK